MTYFWTDKVPVGKIGILGVELDVVTTGSGSGTGGGTNSDMRYVPVEFVNAGTSNVPVELVTDIVEFEICASASPTPSGTSISINATTAIPISVIEA